jgi:archaemetzincin
MIQVYQQEHCDFFELTANALKNELAQDTSNAGTFVLPENAFNPLRHQFEAMKIIDHITVISPDAGKFKLGIVDKDIYAHGMNFIFGLADPLSNTAIVSSYRLSGEKKSERISKEVVHEVGHLLGLSHCHDRSCVMYFSNTIEDTDNKNQQLCNTCRSKLDG